MYIYIYISIYIYIYTHILVALLVLSFGWDYLSNAACLIRPRFVLCAVYGVKGHHTLPNELRLLKNVCVRQVVLDKWFPLTLPAFSSRSTWRSLQHNNSNNITQSTQRYKQHTYYNNITQTYTNTTGLRGEAARADLGAHPAPASRVSPARAAEHACSARPVFRELGTGAPRTQNSELGTRNSELGTRPGAHRLQNHLGQICWIRNVLCS